MKITLTDAAFAAFAAFFVVAVPEMLQERWSP